MHASHFLWLRRSFPVSISLFNTTFYPASSSTSTSATLPPLPPSTSRPFFWIVAYGFFFLGTSFPSPPHFLDVTFFMNFWGCPFFFFPIFYDRFFFSSCLNNNQLKCIQYPSSIVVAIPRPLFPFSPFFFTYIFPFCPTHTHDFGVSPSLPSTPLLDGAFVRSGRRLEVCLRTTYLSVILRHHLSSRLCSWKVGWIGWWVFCFVVGWILAWAFW